MASFAKIIIFISFLFLIFLEFFHPISAIDQDLGRHIALGNMILDTRQVPATNLFSYTNPGFPFINTHWLAEVVFSFVVRSVGFSGLLIITTSVVMLTFFLLFWPYLKQSSFLALAVTALLSAGIIFDRTDIRPEIFSFFFLTLFLTILFKNQKKTTKLLFLLPFIELLWVNTHIYFIIGPLLLGLFLIDSLVSWKIQKTAPGEHTKNVLIVFFLSLVAMCINPHGITGALYPLFVFQNYGYSIEENQSIFLVQSLINNPAIYYFEISSSLLVILLTIYRKKVSWLTWALAGIFIYFGVMAVRNMSLYVFVSFGLLVQYLTMFGSSLQNISFIAKRKSLLTVLCAAGILLITISSALNFLSMKSFGFGMKPQAKKAIDFVQSHHVKGPIFNNFDIGSYLIYTLYPFEKVFVDGRPEAYPASFFQNTYIPMQENQTAFAEAEKKYHFQTIFFSHTDQTPWAQIFLKQIMTNHSWQTVYLDENVIILVKNIPENQQLIKQYGIQDETFHPDTILNQDTPKQLVLFSYYLDGIGWEQTEKKVLQEAIRKKPTFCPALYQLALLYGREQNEALSGIYFNTLNAVCPANH